MCVYHPVILKKYTVGNGKGSAYRKVDSAKYSKNYERLYGPAKLNLWPRDSEGNLIEDEGENNDQ